MNLRTKDYRSLLYTYVTLVSLYWEIVSLWGLTPQSLKEKHSFFNLIESPLGFSDDLLQKKCGYKTMAFHVIARTIASTFSEKNFSTDGITLVDRTICHVGIRLGWSNLAPSVSGLKVSSVSFGLFVRYFGTSLMRISRNNIFLDP